MLGVVEEEEEKSPFPPTTSPSFTTKYFSGMVKESAIGSGRISMVGHEKSGFVQVSFSWKSMMVSLESLGTSPCIIVCPAEDVVSRVLMVRTMGVSWPLVLPWVVDDDGDDGEGSVWVQESTHAAESSLTKSS